MISASVILELQELDHPQLEAAAALFIRACHAIAVENDPRTATGDGGSSRSKPGSRAPGREQCASAVKRLVQLAQQADNKAAEIRERAHVGIESMGGIRVTVEDGKLVGRRRDGTFTGASRGPRLPNLCQET